jgi:hypothetical protein
VAAKAAVAAAVEKAAVAAAGVDDEEEEQEEDLEDDAEAGGAVSPTQSTMKAPPPSMMAPQPATANAGPATATTVVDGPATAVATANPSFPAFLDPGAVVLQLPTDALDGTASGCVSDSTLEQQLPSSSSLSDQQQLSSSSSLSEQQQHCYASGGSLRHRLGSASNAHGETTAQRMRSVAQRVEAYSSDVMRPSGRMRAGVHAVNSHHPRIYCSVSVAHGGWGG